MNKISQDLSSISSIIPKITPHLMVRDEKFGIITLNKLSKRKFFANAVVNDILKFCDGKYPVGQIIRKIKRKYRNLTNKELSYFFQKLASLEFIDFPDSYKDPLDLPRGLYPYSISNVTIPLMGPAHIYWEITYRCNLNCKHCYAKDRYKDIKELSTGACLKIIDELAKLKVFEITFSGGEPLMRKDLVKIIKHANTKNISALLTTNGALISKKMASNLKNAGLQAVQVSLDGASAAVHDNFRGVKGSFASALRGIKNLVAANIPVVIATMPTTRNFQEIPKIIRLAEKLNVRGYRILECKPFGRGIKFKEGLLPLKDYKKLIKLIVKERKRLKNKMFILLSESFAFCINKSFKRNINEPLIDCPAGRSMCAIIPDGRVSPCSYFSFINVFCGDIKKTSLKKIWQKAKFIKQLRQINFSNSKYNKGICNYCRYFEKCGRGCRALAYLATGKIDGLDPRCLASFQNKHNRK